jgi:polysaccharide export outer membrane protein
MRLPLLLRLVLALAAPALAGCAALPGAGPLASQIDEDEPPGALEGLVAPLSAEVAAFVSRPAAGGFPPDFLAAPEIDPVRIGVGDALEVTVWESGEPGLFGAEEGGVTLGPLLVEPDGAISVPFVGRVRAAGVTTPRLRERLRAALEPLALSPQVDVRRVTAPSRLVAVQGAVAQPGLYEIEPGSTRLGPMLARAGGATQPPEQIEVALRRGGRAGAETLDRVLRDAALDVALAPEDQIVLNPIRERFIALGATNAQAQIAFPSRPLDLLSAIALALGLNDFDADPSGVFLFRREPEAVADALLPGPPPEGLPPGPGRPVVYRLDLTEPESFFVARAFAMRDGDAIFVTNAPLTELRKFVTLFTTAVAPVRSSRALAPAGAGL